MIVKSVFDFVDRDIYPISIGFSAYEKQFHSCVIPVLDSASNTWGFKNFQSMDNIQNRAIRYVIGVHRFALRLHVYRDNGQINIIDVGFMLSNIGKGICPLTMSALQDIHLNFSGGSTPYTLLCVCGGGGGSEWEGLGMGCGGIFKNIDSRFNYI